MKVQTYKTEYSWNMQTEYWLKTKTIGFALNFPCGKSNVGNVRCDIDRRVSPDIIASYTNPPFKARSFDTVICDPIFKDYYRFPRVFINEMAKLARKRLIFSSPLVRISPKRKCFSNYVKSMVITDEKTLQLRLWQIFDKQELVVEGDK